MIRRSVHPVLAVALLCGLATLAGCPSLTRDTHPERVTVPAEPEALDV